MTHASLLHRALLADAVISGATGLLLAVGAPALSGLLGLPAELLRSAGLFLVPFAALVGWTAARATPSHAVTRSIMAVNAVWVIGSLLLLLSGRVDPTAPGLIFVMAQAVLVALLTEAQYLGLRKARSSSPLLI